MKLAQRVREALGADVAREMELGGGCIADVRRLTLADGRDVVAKSGTGLVPPIRRS